MIRCIKYALILAIITCSGGCKESMKEFPVISLDNPKESATLKLSQFVDNIQCIPLESADGVIIPDERMRLWVSDKYIITVSDKDIRQFSPDGKHLRKLASAGKGPDEYIHIPNFTVDEKNDILYYSHPGDWNSIYAIDLKNGNSLAKIKTNCLVFQMRVIDGNIFCVPMVYNNQRNSDLFIITPSGEVTDSILKPEDDGKSEAKIIITANKLIPGNEQDIYLDRNDTIYKLNFKGNEAFAAIEYGNKFSPMTNPKGVDYEVLLKTPEFFVIQKSDVNFQQSEQMVSMSATTGDALIVDCKTFNPVKIDEFYIDPLDLGRSEVPSFEIRGNRFVWKISAFQLKEIAEMKKEKGETLSPILEQLNRQLTEESNPVIITGELK